MSQLGQWETKLGMVGAYLDDRDARHIEIVNRDSFLTVFWEGTDAHRHERCFFDAEFARPSRAATGGQGGSRSQALLLSGLGHEIDREAINVACIVEEAGGFVVSGSSAGRYVNQCYAYSELQPATPVPSAGGRFPLVSRAKEMLLTSKQSSPLTDRLHHPRQERS
jgi:hypothetical protein